MQHLPKNGEKKSRSNADDADSRENGEAGRSDDESKPSRSYYYDDAYGYEDYEPSDDEEPDEKDQTPAF